MNLTLTLIGTGVVFAAVFGFAAYARYLQHKENLALAEKGLLPEEDQTLKGRAVLRWGMIFSVLGLILLLVMLPFAWNNFWILFLLGLLPLALGLGLMLIYVIIQDSPAVDQKPKASPPSPKPKKPAKPAPKVDPPPPDEAE